MRLSTTNSSKSYFTGQKLYLLYSLRMKNHGTNVWSWESLEIGEQYAWNEIADALNKELKDKI